MNVNASGSMQQMQIQNMYGAGGGQGKGGMKDIMQSLSSEDRSALKEQMSSLSQADKQSMVAQMKEVDATSMSSDEYAQTLLDMLDQLNTEQSTSSAAYDFSTYV
ncbi:hypothetical protein [Sulfurimonas indica]|uniref:hypothetical protein n=1 Tax=Sulfurimonas indica TaxID=2508707 RepID=UPI001265A694|nr:hypothetical protein [Sulfurimonas indica]